jgi:phosphoadenylyl-sulfate reductase (thioredoxin)
MPIEDVIRQAIDRFGDSLALSTSLQKGGIVVLDVAIRLDPGMRVFTLDTGRLPAETYEMIEAVRSRYGVRVELISPDAREVQLMTGIHGPNLFSRDVSLRMLCCQVRKVRPMARVMGEWGVRAVLTGLRRDQSEARERIEEIDESSSPLRINPLASWTAEEVDVYTEKHGLPVHPLYRRGYTSIGCEPCTRATATGENARAGRWWWENENDKECGIHFTADGQARRKVDVLLDEIVVHG